MACDAKIRPFPGPTELQCEHNDPHPEMVPHEATLRDYAYPGSETVVSWYENDRRTFRGDWAPCSGTCILPAGHRGNHAS